MGPVLRLSVLLAAPLLVSGAYADSVCEKGFRDTTAVERQTMMGVFDAVKAALPQAPTGWLIGGYEVVSPIDNICRDSESTPWAYNFTRILNRTDDAEARDQAAADIGVKLRARQAELQPRQDAIMAKMSTLGGELGAAIQRGDQARAGQIQEEIAKVTAEFEALAQEAEDPAAVDALAAAFGGDRTMSIAIGVNAGSWSNRDAQRVVPTAGAQAVYRWTTVANSVETAHAVFLFGVWQPQTEGAMSASRRGNASSAAAHHLVVTVEADPGRIESLLGSIDFPALAATLAP